MNAGGAKNLFDKYDTNLDGLITLDEWLEHCELEEKNTLEKIEEQKVIFSKMDCDHDGVINFTDMTEWLILDKIENYYHSFI